MPKNAAYILLATFLGLGYAAYEGFLPKETIVITGLLAMAAFLLYWAYYSYTAVSESNFELTDREILHFIGEQADGLASAEILSDRTDLNKSEAKNRLSLLHMRQVLHGSHSSHWPYQTHYSLKQKIDERTAPVLSNNPFLSVEDLLKLFIHHDYKLTLHDLIMATNLPINIIVREMKYFIKNKIVNAVTQSYSPDGMTTVYSKSFYVLRGEYRDNPESLIKDQEKYNLDLSKIYEKLKQKD